MNGTDQNRNGVYIIVSAVPGQKSGIDGEVVIRFRDQPVLNESRSARYEPESLLHAPESYNAYAATEQREFSLDGRFFTRNYNDAKENNQIINVVRSLVLPDYNATGAPPTPVRLYAYGSSHIYNLPCLVRGYSLDYPNDVDYVQYYSGEHDIIVPTIFTISFTLVEQHSVKALREFSLSDFRKGDMVLKGF